jgi:hypothetical protein
MPSYSGIFNLQAQMQAVAANNWPSPPPTVIGQPFGGGFWAGQISVTGSGVATHNLVIGPLSSAQIFGAWKTSGTNTAGTDSVIDGPANTAAMIAAGAAAHPCGQFCDNLVVGGFSDWYMPAQNELEVCYFNLKPTTDANWTSSGANPNAVPARFSNYTAGNPTQTSALAFQSGGSEAFSGASITPMYWASNQTANQFARTIRFVRGQADQAYKPAAGTNYFVRAVRRVAV